MSKRTFNSQMTTYKTYLMYMSQCINLAENVFQIKDLDLYDFDIDIGYVNSVLLRNGSIAFFMDEIMGLCALPYNNISKLDIYGRPTKIIVHGANGYHRTLKRGEFVIMYDNNNKRSILNDILLYAERLATDTITSDINLKQQRTPRIIQTKPEYEKSIKDMINKIESNVDLIATYDAINLDETSMVLAPAPFVADKIDAHKDKTWAEFLRLVGITNMSVMKKERNISDEISAMNGGTIASRFSRFDPRQRAINQINKLWNLNLSVEYYDGVPSSVEDFEDDLYNATDENPDEEGADNNDR